MLEMLDVICAKLPNVLNVEVSDTMPAASSAKAGEPLKNNAPQLRMGGVGHEVVCVMRA
jgi:hypothetical protein